MAAKDKLVVVVRGIPGTGKTWLCEKISEFPKDQAQCFDTDMYITRAYEESPAPMEDVRRAAKDMIISDTTASTSRLVIIVGNTLWTNLHSDPDTEKIYIRPSAEEFREIYSRTLRWQVNLWKTARIPDDLEGEELAW